MNLRNVAYARAPQNPMMNLKVMKTFSSLEIAAIRLARQQNQLRSKWCNSGTARRFLRDMNEWASAMKSNPLLDQTAE